MEQQHELKAREWQAEQQQFAHERDVAWQKQRDWFIAVTEDIPALEPPWRPVTTSRQGVETVFL